MTTGTNDSVKVYITTKSLSSDSTANDTYAETTNSSPALKLELSINSSTIQSGQSINISLSLFNTLPRINNVTRASDWAIPALENSSGDFYSCPGWDSVLVFNGYYTQSNVSSAIPMNVNVDGPAYCPNLNFDNYVFQPTSSQATVYGAIADSSGVEYSMTSTNTIAGFVSPNSSYTQTSSAIPTPFGLGIYTIAAGDEWGQMVLLYFVVGSAIETQTTV
jgi:hypothetical protein